MFKYEFEGASAIATVADMLLRLERLPVDEELTVWQSDDMNRKRPETRTARGPTDAYTIIRNRGRKKRTWKKRPKGYVTPKKFRVPGGRFAKSKRPILRPVLVEALEDRMSDMMRRELQW